jgi:hypothetical protein
MTIKKSLGSLINKHQNKILFSLFITLGIVSLVFTSLVGIVSIQNSPSKISQASGVYQCATGETLSGTNCLSAATSYPIYTEACGSGYTAMDSVCVTFTQKTCTDFTEGAVDTTDSTLCKFNNINNVLLSEITDSDGRQCKGVGYNFKRYNVGLATNSTAGPIVCSSAISGVSGKANFRFLPRFITSIKNFVTTQSGTSAPFCSPSYTLTNSQCSIPALVTSCTSGEYLSQSGSNCQACPSNQSCNTNPITSYSCPTGSTKTAWTGGGSVPFKCFIKKTIPSVLYTDGCTVAYVRYDQTCAIEEDRTHDLGCSYFYASDFVNVTAVQDPNATATTLLKCSTGGRTDFANTSIAKISDLQCDGPGTAWYSYNVAYDPLVCGNTYDVNNKAAFRWSEKTFTKIVGLQKLPNQTTVCPSNWTNYDTTDCIQDPVTQIFYSTTSTTNGGGTIIISNSVSSSSVSKLDCVLKPNEYRENNECKPCPAGTIVTSSSPVSIRDCITIVNVDKPTIRSGGLNEIQNLVIVVSIISLFIAIIQIKKHNQKFLNGWFKVK